MEIKPIVEKLKIYSTEIEKNRKNSKVSKSRVSEDKKFVQISEQAKQIQRIRKIIDEMPDVRPEIEELLDKLSKEIKEGTYLKNVSGQDIVQQIITRLSER